MPNIASVLKAEIARIARREVRSETDMLKKQVTRYRSDIANLKRQVSGLTKQLKANSKASRHKPEPQGSAPEGLRFRAAGFAAHRKRLGLSAAQAGALIGVSGQTIYHWEEGKAKPRASHMERIAALRKLGKRQAAAAVSQVIG
ncbi:DNA-binding transcriptional regulator [Caenimonas sp. SL110]|uniref:helix-turn-helix domain-containing protein n=1 Tax=Caenimonas sp. SL110 TaxID=1450524 RepID=UPI00065366E0|nr:helix-turn-helix transcriptional regulator [Caenimonas sp. SL110]